jgi:plastocyanin
MPMRFRSMLALVPATAVIAALALWPSVGGAGTATDSTTKRVSVKDDLFSPSTIRIKPRTKVTWTVKGVDGHTVTFRSVPAGVGHIKGTGVMDEGEHYSHTFRKRGTYRYVCRPHESSGMKGKVVVR